MCSAVAFVLPPGVFITIMFLFLAASTSTLSTPAPALPIIFKFERESIKSFRTLVAERMIKPS